MGASARSLFENIAGIKNSRKLFVFLPKPELVQSPHRTERVSASFVVPYHGKNLVTFV